MKHVDLHLHSNHSDGSLAQKHLVYHCAVGGLDIISLTDHDTTTGVAEAIREGAKFDLKVIPGIELSAAINEIEIHILGYNIDINNAELIEHSNKIMQMREVRAKKILTKLNELGIKLNYEEIREDEDKVFIGRNDIASAMVARNFVNNRFEAFEKYLGEGKPAYQKCKWVSVEESIRLIKNAGGISIFAHPTIDQFKMFVSLFKKYGLDGVEIYRPSRHIEDQVYMEFIASNMNLLVTGGSDWHSGPYDRLGLGDFYVSCDKIDNFWD